MNGEHLRAFAWLRWRLLVNQWRRGGALNVILMITLSIAAVVTVIPLLIGSFWLGLFLIPKAQPIHLMYLWDGLVLVFLGFWCAGLLAELQRAESLSLSKFLHLPVSAGGAFLLNYLSAFLRLSTLIFAPVMIGFGAALVYVRGLSMFLVLPSVAAFFLMITALTYQFQGWLGRLMTNPRHRRTVIVSATTLFILLAQLPNLINFLSPWDDPHRRGPAEVAVDASKEPDHAPDARTDPSDGGPRPDGRLKNRDRLDAMESTARILNMVLPVGWLPLGVMTAAEGNLIPSALGFLGMSLVGAASLRRSYRTTVQQYQGKATSRKPRASAVPAAAGAQATPEDRTAAESFMERRLPWLSEPAAAIALANFRALSRAPEAKIVLLTPIIMGPIFGSMLWRQRQVIPESLRPLLATGAMVFLLMGMIQMMGNMFGLDRDGFRVLVLSAVPRRGILLGKNLSFAPIVLAMMGVFLGIAQVVCPMRWDHILALLFQAISMFLLFCLCTNLMSIYTPLHVAAGSLRPSNPRLTTILLQLLMTLILMPLTQALTLLPLGIEVGLRFLGIVEAVPLYLLLSVVQCALVVLIYGLLLTVQGNDLQAREQRILESVTGRVA